MSTARGVTFQAFDETHLILIPSDLVPLVRMRGGPAPATRKEWEPGEPLYPRPPRVMGAWSGQQITRRMIEVLDDEVDVLLAVGAPNYCPTCLVAGTEVTCWMCGGPTTMWPHIEAAESCDTDDEETRV